MVVRLLTVACLALLLAGCGRSGDPLTFGGYEVLGAQETLTQVERHFVQDHANNPATVLGEEPRCYFLRLTETEIGDYAFCAPISYFGAEGPWAAYLLESRPSPDGVTLTVGAQMEYGTDQLQSGMFYRPDGAAVPDDEELFLPPPPLAPNEVFVHHELPEVLDSGAPLGWDLRFAREDGRQVEIDLVHRTDSLGSGYHQYLPAEGQELLVVGFGTTDLESGTLVVDGARFPFDTYAPYLIGSIPAGATELVLEFTDSGATQTLSLRDGSRGGDADPGLELAYRSNLETELRDRYDATLLIRDVKVGEERLDYELTIRLRYVRAELLTELEIDDVRLEDDRVWLKVSYEDAEYTTNVLHRNTLYEGNMEWEVRFTGYVQLEVPGEGTIDGLSFAYETWGKSRPSGMLLFPVDPGFETGTVTLTPTGEWETRMFGEHQARGDLEFPTSTLEVSIPTD
jgi:hypothetical protein